MDIKEYEELFGKYKEDIKYDDYNYESSYATKEECESRMEEIKELEIKKRIENLKCRKYALGKRIAVANWIINLDKFKKEIGEYVLKNDRLPYIFMNCDTAEMFWEDINNNKEEYPEDAVLTDINPSYISGKLDVGDLMWHYGYYDDWEDKDIPEDADEKIKKLSKEYYGTLGRYNGCKVFFNNDLDYGKVEIR